MPSLFELVQVCLKDDVRRLSFFDKKKLARRLGIKVANKSNKSKLSNVIGVAAFIVNGIDVGAPPLMEELILMSNMYDAYINV